jgi:hypothetical protein
MRRFRHPLLLSVIALLLALTASPVEAEGLSTGLSASSSQPAVGQTITLTVSLTAKIDVANYDLMLVYDPAAFQFIAGSEKNLASNLATFDINQHSSSSIKVVAYGGIHHDIANLCQLRFKALHIGPAQFSVTDTCVNDDLYPASSVKAVTIVEPAALSGTNTLKSLEIDQGVLTPAFSPEQQAYTAAIESLVSQLIVSAVPVDSKATVSISGESDFQDGDNQILIVVTAENGSKRTYTIIATRAAPAPTPEATPTPPVMLDLAAGTFAVSEPPPGTVIPEGFFQTMASLNGQMVPSFNAMKGGLVLFYLARDAGGSGFYYYSSQSQSYLPFDVLEMPRRSYSVLVPGTDASVPAGFVKTLLILDSQSLPAWKPDQADPGRNGHDMYLLYLMDSQGDKNFYWLDKTSKTLSLFLAPQEISPEPSSTPSPMPEPQQTQEPDGTAGAFDPWQLASVLLGLLSLFLAGTVIWLAVQQRQNRSRYQGSIRVDPVNFSQENTPSLTEEQAEKIHREPKPKAPRIKRID